MLHAQIIRSLAGRNLEKNAYLANAALRHVFNVRQASQAAPAIAESQKTPQVTTGWNKAKWPQQEMMEIHRRAAKIEPPGLERRRQFAVLKVALAIGAGAVAYIIFGCLVIMFFPWDPHAPWHSTGIATPWTNSN